MGKTKKIEVENKLISIVRRGDEDFISLTDMAKYRDSNRSDYIIQNWMRTRSTIEFIGLGEQLHNPDFNSIEFDGFRNEAGLNRFTLTPKQWIQNTNAIGVFSKAERNGGTYAHRDIAFELSRFSYQPSKVLPYATFTKPQA